MKSGTHSEGPARIFLSEHTRFDLFLRNLRVPLEFDFRDSADVRGPCKFRVVDISKGGRKGHQSNERGADLQAV